MILGRNAAAENDLAARPSHHDGADDHEHDDFDTVVIELPEIADPEALKAAIIRLAREQAILRVKGYVAVAGKPMRMLVQAVGERVRAQYDKPWGDAPRASRLVVIGEHDDVDPAAIRAVLAPENRRSATSGAAPSAARRRLRASSRSWPGSVRPRKTILNWLTEAPVGNVTRYSIGIAATVGSR